MARTQPSSAVVAPYRLVKISASAGLRNASCRPHSNADDGTSSRLGITGLSQGSSARRMSAGLRGGAEQDLVQRHPAWPGDGERDDVGDVFGGDGQPRVEL